VVPLEIDRMKTGGIEWEDVDGVTKLPHMVKRHRNLVGLSYKTLGTIAYHTVERFRCAVSGKSRERRCWLLITS
jgi:hypothetical protein